MKCTHGIWTTLLTAVTVYFGPMTVQAAGGSGTTNDPYLISTCTELQNIKDNLTANYVINNDIDCTDTKNWNNGLGFQPIGGDNSGGFTGQLNGNEFHIKNLYMNRPDDWNVGLFGYLIGASASVQNVTLDNVSVKGINANAITGGVIGSLYNTNNVKNITVSGTVEGAAFAGSAIGYTYYSDVSNVTSSASIKGLNSLGSIVGYANNSKISNTSSSSVVEGTDYVGSIVGYASNSTVTNAHSTSKVKGLNVVGGIVGYSYRSTVEKSTFNGEVTGAMGLGGLTGYMSGGTVTHSFAKGQIKNDQTLSGYSVGRIGGAIGYMVSSTVSNSFSHAAVQCTTNCSLGYVGGFAGQLESGSITNSYSTGSITTNQPSIPKGGFIGAYTAGTVTNSYWDATTSGLATSAGNKGTSKTTTQLKQAATYTGWDFTNLWVLKASLNTGYPTLKQTPPPKLWEVSNLAETHSDTSVTLSWVPPTDSEFDFINIYRNGVKIATSADATYTNTGLISDVSYTYKLTTVDTRGNESIGQSIVASTTDTIPTDPVTGVTATEVSGQVQLNWTNPSTLDFHHVTVKRNGTTIYTGNAQTFLDTTVLEKVAYTYEITAYDDDNNASTSVQKTITTLDRTPPAEASQVVADEESVGVKLTWTNPEELDFSNVTVTKNGTVVYSGSSTMFLDTDVMEKTTYTYIITSMDYDGNQSSGVSVAITTRDKTPPNGVNNVRLMEKNGELHLTWENPLDNDIDYIQVTKNGVLVYQGNATFFTDSKFTEKTAYLYKITVVDTSGNLSSAVAVSIATADHTPPQSVSNVMVTEQTDHLLLTWRNPIDLDFSYVQLKRNGLLLFQGNILSWKDTFFIEKTKYTYEITAFDETGHRSATVTSSIVTKDKTAPDPVTNLNVKGKGKTVTVTWTLPENDDLEFVIVKRNGDLVYKGLKQQWIDTNSKENQLYVYEVIAVDKSDNRSLSSSVKWVKKSQTIPSIEKVRDVIERSEKTKEIPKPSVDSDSMIEKEKNQVVESISMTKTTKKIEISWKKTSRYPKAVIYLDGVFLKELTEDHFIDFIQQDGKNHRYTLVILGTQGDQIVKEFLHLAEKPSIPKSKEKEGKKPNEDTGKPWIVGILLLTLTISMWLLYRTHRKNK